MNTTEASIEVDCASGINMVSRIFSRHDIMFSKTVAAKLVGGHAKLLRLIDQGKVRIGKRADSPNGKWYCEAGDIIRYLHY